MMKLRQRLKKWGLFDMRDILVRPYFPTSMSATEGGVFITPSPYDKSRFGLEIFSSVLERPLRISSKTAYHAREAIADLQGYWVDGYGANCPASHLDEALRTLHSHSETGRLHKGIFIIDHCSLDVRTFYRSDLGILVKNIGNIINQQCNGVLGTSVTAVIWLLNQEELAILGQFRGRDLVAFEKETRTHMQLIDTPVARCLICEFGGK